MTTLKNFLSWFEGFCVIDTPTLNEAEWTALKNKIRSLKSSEVEISEKIGWKEIFEHPLPPVPPTWIPNRLFPEVNPNPPWPTQPYIWCQDDKTTTIHIGDPQNPGYSGTSYQDVK